MTDCKNCFCCEKAENEENKDLLLKIYDELKKGGFDPAKQISGFIISDDPTYIADIGGARTLAGKLDRNALLEELIEAYTKNANEK